MPAMLSLEPKVQRVAGVLFDSFHQIAFKDEAIDFQTCIRWR